jgi:hypothetical protein
METHGLVTLMRLVWSGVVGADGDQALAWPSNQTHEHGTGIYYPAKIKYSI